MNEKEFEEKLELLKERLLGEGDRLGALTSESFEELVAKIMEDLVDEPVQYQKGSARFPDIAIPPFGIEVKFTISDKWVSVGNSILESSRSPGVDRVYICFLKAGGEPNVSVRPYDDVMSDIVVTHSPRYRIDMTASESIFDRMGVTYDDFRSGDPIGNAKEYYRRIVRETGGSVWWLDERKEESAPPVLRMYSSLSQEGKTKLMVELMALFPELISETSSGAKYDEPTLYLISKYNVVNRSLRDMFSAGGRGRVPVGEGGTEVSRAIRKLYEYAKRIKERIEELDEETLEDCWDESATGKNAEERITIYEFLLDKHVREQGEGILASTIFRAGITRGEIR